MLPLPATFSHGFGRGHASSRHYRSPRDVLLARARITNLGFYLLAALAAASVLLNLSHYLSSPSPSAHSRHDSGGPYAAPHAVIETIARDRALGELEHLVLVPGHAIWRGSRAEEGLDEDRWVLEPYQRGGGRVAAFVKHIAAAAEIARADERALLVFSGGQTRPSSTTTEAESYMRLAALSSLLPHLHSPSASPSLPILRATTEDHALDSFQNLLFALARFHEYTGRWPARVTVVGYEMKRRRFEELHRAALRWPAERFVYVGIDAEDGADAATAKQGELQNGYLPYTQDTYGCRGALLQKRRARNPFARFHSYYSSAPELGPLFNWCPSRAEGGPTAIYPGPLPWDELS